MPFLGYSIQKTLGGCATNMASKISLLVHEWPLIKCKIWYMSELIFQNWLKFKKILKKKMVDFAQNLAQIEPIGIWMGHFFLKIWYFYGSTLKFGSSTSLPRLNFSTPRVPLWYYRSLFFFNCRRCQLALFQLTMTVIKIMSIMSEQCSYS